jgi:hypothetical protein
VVLPVTFGETRENYRTKYIKFEIADFETSYHAILGKSAIATFMAVPHYTYLVHLPCHPRQTGYRQVQPEYSHCKGT